MEYYKRPSRREGITPENVSETYWISWFLKKYTLKQARNRNFPSSMKNNSPKLYSKHHPHQNLGINDINTRKSKIIFIYRLCNVLPRKPMKTNWKGTGTNKSLKRWPRKGNQKYTITNSFPISSPLEHTMIEWVPDSIQAQNGKYLAGKLDKTTKKLYKWLYEKGWINGESCHVLGEEDFIFLRKSLLQINL